MCQHWFRIPVLQNLVELCANNCRYLTRRKVNTLVSSCGRFPVLWTNYRQAHLTFLVNVWMIDLCLERNLWRLERIFGWKIYPHTECTLVVWRTLLQAAYMIQSYKLKCSFKQLSLQTFLIHCTHFLH